MKRFMSVLLSLAIAGVIGMAAGCKKKEEAPAPAPEQPKVEQPAQPAPAENQTQQAPAEKPAEQPAEKK